MTDKPLKRMSDAGTAALAEAMGLDVVALYAGRRAKRSGADEDVVRWRDAVWECHAARLEAERLSPQLVGMWGGAPGEELSR